MTKNFQYIKLENATTKNCKFMKWEKITGISKWLKI